MDMSGAMPREVFVDIHDEASRHLAHIECEIRGGTVLTDYPAFAPGTRGRKTTTCVMADGERSSAEGEFEELPTEAYVEVSNWG